MSSNTNFFLKKKIANIINNQLEYFLFFSSKQNTFINFPNQNPKHPKTQNELQHLQNPKCLISTSKHKLPSLNKKCKLPSFVIAYSYGLEFNDTTMSKLYRCHWKVESK